MPAGIEDNSNYSPLVIDDYLNMGGMTLWCIDFTKIYLK